jgi:hypothetical protein
MTTARKPFARSTAAICGYYITRIGKRVVLDRGSVGAWTRVSSNASLAQIRAAGFNLDSPEVAKVCKFAR